jgi:hypothetical protein
LYEDLPQVVQREILKEGETRFCSELSNNKEAIGDMVAKQFNPQMLNNFFGQVNPEGILNQILGNSMGELSKNLGLGGFGGGVQNFIGGIF